MTERLVLDASVLVDLLAGTALSGIVRERICRASLSAPAHVDAEVISAMARLHRAGALPELVVERRVRFLAAMPLERHALPPLLTGAWGRRQALRLSDALYVELASRLGVPLLTTDLRLARATPLAEALTL